MPDLFHIISVSTEIEERKDEDANNDIELPKYDFDTIAIATDNFSSKNKLGEGGFGPVYKVI